MNQLRTLAVLILSILLALTADGQVSFQKTFWNADTTIHHYGNSVIQMADEGYIIAGGSVNLNNFTGNGMLKRTDKYGKELWTKYYTNNQDDIEFSNIQKTSDGNLIVTGIVNYGVFSSNYYDAYLAKIDLQGNVIWEKNYGGQNRQWTRQVKQTSDNGFILAGYDELNGAASDISFYLVRVDALGDTIWTKSYFSGYQQSANAVVQSADGGFVLAGKSNSHFTLGVAYVIKTDKNGDTLWTKYLTEIGTSTAYDITGAHNGNILITGLSQLNINGCSQPVLVELDLNGNVVWYKIYEDGPCGWSYSVTKTNDYGYALFGMDQNQDGYLIRTDSLGAQRWFKKFDENQFVYGYNIRQTVDNGFIMTGLTGNTTTNVLLIKTDDEGNVTGIDVEKSNAQILIYPNPTAGIITIEIPQGIRVRDIRIYNTLGQQLLYKIVKDPLIAIDIANLPAGLYYLKMDEITTQKIIKY